MENTMTKALFGSVEAAHKMWGWLLTLGIALIVLGGFAVYYATVATVASVIAFGVIIALAGAAEIAAAFMSRGAGHVILMLLLGALDILVGLMLIGHPGIGALVLTLFLAMLFLFSGVYRFTVALWLQFPHYGWFAFSALVSIALGILLWIQWPASAYWFIGLAVGINFVIAGWAWSSLAFRLKNA